MRWSVGRASAPRAGGGEVLSLHRRIHDMPRILLPLRSDRQSRGATAVEYALVLALVVFAAAASIEFLGERGAAEVVNQADCVSMRPPPPECQVASVAPENNPTIPGFVTPTTSVSVPGPFPLGDVDGAVTITPDPLLPLPSGAPWSVSVPVSVLVEVTMDPLPDPPFEPVGSVEVRARVRLVDGLADPPAFLPVSEFVTCVTDVTGRCTLVYDVPPFENMPALRIDQFVVNSVPPGGFATAAVDVIRPPLP